MAEQVDDFAAGEVRPQRDIAGHACQSSVEIHAVTPGIAPQELDLPRLGTEQAQQDPDGRGLTRPVGTEEAVNLARLDRQIETVQGAGRSERLDQPLNGDRRQLVAPRVESAGRWWPRDGVLSGGVIGRMRLLR